jgi:F0F1-type ATP synthase beta subunit
MKAKTAKNTPRGVEPLSDNSKVVDNKTLTKNTNSVLSTSLDNLLQRYPDLADLVRAWPELPEHIKTAIKALIQTNHKGE